MRAPLQKYPRVVNIYDSTNVNSIAYSPDEKLLLVEYKGGGTYEYQRVSAEEFGKVVGAASVGKAIVQYIKPKQARKLV